MSHQVEFSGAPSVEELVAAQERALLDPPWWIRDVLGVTLQPHQVDLIEDYNREKQDPNGKRQIAWASCNSAAKTHTLSALCLHHVYNEFDSKVLNTAPTATQLDQVLWAEMRSMIAKARLPLGGNLLPRAPQLHIAPEWYMIGLNAAIPEAFQGRKSRKLLIVVDEASGCKDPMFEAMRGNMASGDAMLLMAFNPTRATGQSFRAFHSARADWHCRQIDAFDLPNLAPIKAEFDAPGTTLARKLELLRTAPVVVPYLATGKWAAGILAEFGEDSDMWRVRVRGQFPKGDPNQLITMGDAVDSMAVWREIAAMSRDQSAAAAKDGKPFPWWRFRELLGDKAQGGLDVARFGDCDSVLAAQALLTSMPMIAWGQQRTTDLSGFVAEEIERYQLHQTNVDEPGVGGGPCDQLTAIASGIVPFNGGKAAWNPARFANLRSEQFWALRILLQKHLAFIPDSERLLGQLTSIRYSFLPQGQRRVETKEELAARGITKFDEGDAVMMSYAQVPGADAVMTGRDTLTPLEI